MILNALLATTSLCVGAWILTVLQSLPPVVPLKKVKDYQGRPVTVCARVVTHDCASKDRTTTLHLDNPYWSRPVAVLITGQARGSFPPRLEDRYVLGDICATGIVERYEGRHVVRVERPDQITVHDAPPVTPFGPNTVRPCDPGVEKPQLTYEGPPNYTSSAIGARQEGLAFLEAVVLQDGTVGAARVLHGPRPDFGLDQEALNAVRQWRFKPGTAAKLPAAVVVTIELSFRLK